MRARQRHLNQRFAGAGLVFDSRFINQSDNTAVSTWSDRSGNGWDATQGASALRPTFIENELNGNPVVRFDGSDDVLTVSGAVGYLRNVGYGLLVAVGKDRSPTTGNADHSIFYFSNGSLEVQFRLGLQSRSGGVNTFRMGARRLDADAFTGTATNITSNSNFNIFTAIGNYSLGNISLIVNNKTESTANLPSAGSTSNTNSISVNIGRSTAAAGFMQLDAGLLLAFNQSLSDALRMRIHRSAAIAYKIACN